MPGLHFFFFHLQKFRECKEQVIEQVGSYDPLRNERDEHLIALNFDRIQYWLGQGTVATEPVEKIFGTYCGECSMFNPFRMMKSVPDL